MTSYIPEYRYGHIPGTYGEFGLLPWPEHMRPRGAADNLSAALPDLDLPALFAEPSGIDITKKGEAYVAGILKPYGAPQGIDPRLWRKSVETRLNELLDAAMSLITALDMMEVDPDLEETGDEEPTLGWTARGPSGFGKDADEREVEDEHGGDIQDEPHDDGHVIGADSEPSLGWQDEGNQTTLRCHDEDLEADLGSPEHTVDQIRRLERAPGWLAEDGEPYLAGAHCDLELDFAEFDGDMVIPGGTA